LASLCLPAAAAGLLVASHPKLSTVQVVRASDYYKTPISDLWTENDKAVLVFLRHFG
jgi:hypothetical protein